MNRLDSVMAYAELRRNTEKQVTPCPAQDSIDRRGSRRDWQDDAYRKRDIV